MQIGSSVCFYISTTQIWPFPNGTSQPNAASIQCSSIGFTLATIKTYKEHWLVAQLARKYNLKKTQSNQAS